MKATPNLNFCFRCSLLATLLYLTTTGTVNAQLIGEKGFPDNTYGIGGWKNLLIVNTHKGTQEEIIMRFGPNGIRREKEVKIIDTSNSGLKTTISKTYYDPAGKKAFFFSNVTDSKQDSLLKLQAKYLNGLVVSASAWNLVNTAGQAYKYNTEKKAFELADQYLGEGVYVATASATGVRRSKTPKLKFEYVIPGNDHYKATIKNDEYTGGTEVTEAYRDSRTFEDEFGEYEEDFFAEEKKLYDKNHVLRHEYFRAYFEDGTVYEEETYYDCWGAEQYSSYSWYDEYGEEYEFYEGYFNKGVPTAGYYYYDDEYWGQEATYDPVTGWWAEGWHPELNEPEDFSPYTDDCPPDDTEKYWYHDFFAGPVILREDGGGDGFNLYGLALAYNRYFSSRLGITGDINVGFGKDGLDKITKLVVLAGISYSLNKMAMGKPFTIGLRTMAGASFVRSSYMNYHQSQTALTLDAGLVGSYYIDSKFGLRAAIDAAPTLYKNNTSFNLRGEVGAVFRLNNKVAKIQASY